MISTTLCFKQYHDNTELLTAAYSDNWKDMCRLHFWNFIKSKNDTEEVRSLFVTIPRMITEKMVWTINMILKYTKMTPSSPTTVFQAQLKAALGLL